jgi:cytoskeleton protein RodZ
MRGWRNCRRLIEDLRMNNDLPVAQRPSERGPDDQPPMREPGALNLDTVAAVGARLAQLRGERGLTLNDVSARLKVSLAKLKALEAGDLSLLPDATFGLGIVRSYAKMLGTSAEPMLPALRVP